MSQTNPDFDESGAIPLGARTNTQEEFRRLERKVDRMVTSLEKLILIEDRQLNQAGAITEIRVGHAQDKAALSRLIELNKESIDKTEKLLNQWIQRGIGAWVIVTIVASVIGFILTRGS